MSLTEKILNKLNSSPELRRLASNKFKERHEAREKRFKIDAAKRAPDNDFYNRSYNI